MSLRLTRKELIAEFEITFSTQFNSGNFNRAKDTLEDGRQVYTDHITYWAFQAWVSSYETYAGYVSL